MKDSVFGSFYFFHTEAAMIERLCEPNKLGRYMVMTDEREVTDENIERIVNLGWLDHQENQRRESYLEAYKRGSQPILDRVKEVRPEINVKVVENTASEIVNVHKNYCFSRPVTFVQRAKVEVDALGRVTTKDDGDKDDQRISVLNKMNQEQRKAAKDLELADHLFTTGLAYMMVYPHRHPERAFSPFEIMVLNPMTTFVIYSNDAYREPKVAVTYFIHDDGTISLTAYSENFVYELDGGISPVQFIRRTTTPNILGVIPIVEFAMPDRMGIFEKVIPIMDAMNIVNSDRVNDIAQHVQSLLWLHNCELNDEEREKLIDGDGVIMTQSAEGREAKISYLTQTLNQSETQSFVDYWIERIHEITSTPSWNEASGGSTTGAMQLSNGWQSLEISANAVEQVFMEPEMRLIEAELAIAQNDSRNFGGVEDLSLSDIEIKFCRSKNYDLVSKVNALATLINTGVDGETAFATVNLFSDALQAWVDSADTINAIQEKMAKQDARKEDDSQNRNAFAYKDEEGNGGENNDPKQKVEESVQPSKAAQVEE